jgi:DNA ligase-1
MAAKQLSENQIEHFKENAEWMPTLFSQTSSGSIQVWNVGVFENVIITFYGLMDGKHQWTYETIKAGKNLGKVNETTPEEQAHIKASQLFEKKEKEGYNTSLEKAMAGVVDLDGVDPMLAFPIEDKIKYVKFPGFTQPKLDGHRIVAVITNGSVKLFSRTRKAITTLPHIVEQLERAFQGATLILDGEGYNHALKQNFEKLTSTIKRDEVHEDHKIMEYHVYDVAQSLYASPSSGWQDRTKDVFACIVNSKLPNVKVVDTYAVGSMEELVRLHDNFVAKGYEGAMYRNPSTPYEGKRSAGLLKVKVMKDEEFTVVGYVEGKGKFAGGIGSFICRNEKGDEFNVAMNGTIESLEEYLKNFSKYAGRKLTVQYQKKSSYGIPIFPRGLRFREDV